MQQRNQKKILKKRILAFALAFLFVAGLVGGTVYYRTDKSIDTLSKMGSRGDEVRRIQQKLKSLGYFTSAVDGIYGTLTQSAVKRFQRDNGLSVDGIAGPRTLSALGISSGSSGNGQYGSNDVYLLAKVIAAEARGEPYTGQVAVRDAINGWDPSGGAIYYYNPAKTSNRWMRTRPVIVTIGSHLFCK